jgi:hypothetical protein
MSLKIDFNYYVGIATKQNGYMENAHMTRVVHFKKSRYDILIDRTTIFGNPYKIGKDGDRDEVISKFKKWLNGEIDTDWNQFTRREILKRLPELRGKVLG